MQRPTAVIILLVIAAWCAHPLPAAGPVQAPFRTMLPWSLTHREWELATSLTYRDGAFPPFYGGVAPTQRDEWRLELVDVSYGLGTGGEARLRFGVQQVEEEGGLEKTGIQDARLTFAYQIPSGPTLTVAAALDVKLPNASDVERLGTDQTDVLFSASLGHREKKWGWAGQAGLGILGHPLKPGTQDDVLVFGGTGWWRVDDDDLLLFGELEGIAGSRFENNTQTLGAGVLIGQVVPVGVVVRRGLTEESPDWSATITVTIVPPDRAR